MAVQDLTLTRIAQNQSTFRKANENIERAAEQIGVDGSLVPFICECGDRSCTEIVRLTLFDYEEVRRYPRRFFAAPGHERLGVDAGADVVLERRDNCVIGDKIGEAGEITEADYEELPGRSNE